MDLSIRDWMMVIGVLLLIAVALDGYRRSQKERRNRVRVSKTAKKRAKQGRPLSDSACDKTPPEVKPDPANPPRLGNAELGISEPALVSGMSASMSSQASASTVTVSADNPNKPPTEKDDDYVVDPLFENPFEVQSHKTETVEDLHQGVSEDGVIQEGVQQGLDFEINHHNTDTTEPEDIIVLNVMASNAEGFIGEDLIHILKACDCRFGEMNIFHRYESKDAKGKVQFSVVNMVEPGIFNLKDIQEFSTPGVSFFLRLPGPKDPVEAYNCMVEVAQCLVRNLEGVLKDEAHSAVTEQTIEHNRQRILDFQQKKLLTV